MEVGCVLQKKAENGRRGGELKEGSPPDQKGRGRASVRPVIVVWNFDGYAVQHNVIIVRVET